MKSSLFFLLSSLVSLRVLFLGILFTAVTVQAEVNFQDCEFKSPWPQKVRCGTFSSSVSDSIVELPFMIVGSHYKKMPFLYIAGGPGSAAGVGQAFLPYWLNWMDNTNFQRPLIVIDLPGTGSASPQFRCERLQKFNHWMLAAGLSTRELSEQSFAVLKQCQQQMLSEHSVSWMNAGNIAMLLNQFVREFQAEELGVYAVSFGGRIALEMLAQGNDKVDKLILDSPYPPGRQLLQDWPEVFTYSMKLASQSCEKNCRQTPEELYSDIIALLNKLEKQHIRKRLNVSGKQQTLIVTPSVLMDTIFFALYNPDTRQQIPELIRELSSKKRKQKHADRLLAYYASISLDQSFNLMTYYTVSCAGQKPLSQSAWRRLTQKQPEELRTWLEYNSSYDVCNNWPVTKEHEGFYRTPVVAQKALVLLGEQDPVIFAEWFTALRDKNPHFEFRELPESGHVVLEESYCAQQFVAAYLENQKIDVDCL